MLIGIIWTTNKQNSELFLLHNSLNRCLMRKCSNAIHKNWIFFEKKINLNWFLSQLACFVLIRFLFNTNWLASLPKFDSLHERRSHNQCIDSVIKFAHCITRMWKRQRDTNLSVATVIPICSYHIGSVTIVWTNREDVFVSWTFLSLNTYFERRYNFKCPWLVSLAKMYWKIWK